MLLRRIARPMLAALFINGGIQALRHPEGHAQAAKPVLDAVSPAVDKAIERGALQQRPDDELLIKIDAWVKIVAGSMLALGKFPRLASTALAASLIPTTLAGHRFWEETDPEKKQAQEIHFFKNVGLLGGLLIAAADTEGKPSLGWRGRRAARLTAAAAAAQAEALGEAASEIGDRVSDAAHQASGTAAGLAAGLAGLAPGAAASAKAARSKAVKKADKLAAKAAKRSAALQKDAAKRGAALQAAAAARGAELAKKAAKKRAELEKRAPVLVDQVATQATKLGHDVAARASALGAEVVHQAEGVAKDTRKRVAALTG